MVLCMYLSSFVIQLFILTVASYDMADVTRHKNRRLLPPNSQCGMSKGVLPCSGRPRILGGNCKARPGDFPWMASLYTKDRNGYLEAFCGGSIINDRYILTAAHCVDSPLSYGQRYVVQIGGVFTVNRMYCQQGKCNIFDVIEVVKHNKYNKRTIQNDIALLRLSKRIKFSGLMSPICLPFNYAVRQEAIDRTEYMVAGWGEIREGKNSFALKYDKVPIIPMDTCVEKWLERDELEFWMSKKSYRSTVICAGDHRDTCKGDSGGPLMMKNTLTSGQDKYFALGIVSYGQDCDDTHDYSLPAVYTKVTAFLPWILDNIRE